MELASKQSEPPGPAIAGAPSRRDKPAIAGPGGSPTSAKKSIRVTIVQPSLAKYRIPVFRELARRPGINLRVVYGSVKGLENVDAEGFEAVPTERWTPAFFGQGVVWNRADWTYAARRLSDVIVLQWTPRSLSLVPAMLRARAAGVPRILWGHGYAKDERRRRRGARKWLTRFASALVFYEPATRDAYVRDGWDPAKAFVALNSLDHTPMDDARQIWLARPDQLEKFRQEHRIEGGPVILFVSRLLPQNRVDLLIRATAALAHEIPGVKTVIIGNGPAEKARLEALARETGARDRVIFQNGIYDELKLAPWFLSASVFCYPANVGLSLIHALWYGLPVVTSDNLAAQNPEVVALENNVNGLTFEHGSAESLVAALRNIVTNDNLRTTMSQAARRTVEDRFTISRMVDGLEAAIRYAHSTARIRE
ncbi:MAG: glycosyltransferase family 4 protein [Planctomycetes bacterium]|nr:glycosyltransferase family 4 protein [Planctomycetota bacterium]